MKVINLSARLMSAFGYVASNESSTLRKQKFAEANNLSGAMYPKTDASFEEFSIVKNKDEKLLFGSMMSSRTDGNKVFAPPPMCSFSKGKNLIITEMDGGGEVVERYGDKSWQIKMQGVLIDMENHQYPKQQIIKLREFFDVNDMFAVESLGIFYDLKIMNIYFTDVDISGVAGFEDTIQYSLTARSVKPVEFRFVENN